MSMTLTKSVLQKLVKETNNKVFVETGTFQGGGVQLALDCGFENIISIEIEPKYYELAKEKFKDNPKVDLILGDSEVWFDRVISYLDEPAVIWLDAHSHNNTVKLNNPTSLIPELDILAKYSRPGLVHTILIDDIRVIRNNTLWGGAIVGGLELLYSKLRDINFNYQFSLEDNAIAKQDILIASPSTQMIV